MDDNKKDFDRISINLSVGYLVLSSVSTGISIGGAVAESPGLAGVFAAVALFSGGISYYNERERIEDKKEKALQHIADALEKKEHPAP